MAGSKKSPVSSIVVVALALLIFVAAVGIGVSMLNKDKPTSGDDISSSGSSSSSSSSSKSSSGSGSSGSSTSSSGSSTSSSGSSSSGASVSGSASVSTPSVSQAPAKPVVFDPNIMGDSGASKIPNFKKINTDVKGWLKIPGTNIDYPVLHDARIMPAPTYHYYLDKNIYKQTDRDGVIYADPYVKFGTQDKLSPNTVLYGHNWANVSANPRIGYSSDTMFGQLAAYHHLDFAKTHPYIYYSTEDDEMAWVVFAAFYTDIDFIYNVPNATSTDLQNIINGAKARSRHIFDVPVTSSDKIITLSTCTRAYGQSDRQRFVVMAKQMALSDEFVAVGVKANPNPVLPKL